MISLKSKLNSYEREIKELNEKIENLYKDKEEHKKIFSKNREKILDEYNKVLNFINNKKYFIEERYDNDEKLNQLIGIENFLVNTYFSDLNNLNDIVEYIKSSKYKLSKFLRTNKVGLNDNFDSLEQELGNLIREMKILKSGNKAEEETLRVIRYFSDEAKYLVNNRICVKDYQSGQSINAENDIIIICKKGIFLLEIKNSSKDLIIDKNGNLVKKGANIRAGSDIVQQCINHLNVVRRVLKEELEKLDIRNLEIYIQPIIVTANNSIRIEIKNNRIPVLLKNEIQEYIFNNYENKTELCNEEIELFYKILKYREVGLAKFKHNININLINNELSKFIVVNNNYIADFDKYSDEIITDIDNQINEIQDQINVINNDIETLSYKYDMLSNIMNTIRTNKIVQLIFIFGIIGGIVINGLNNNYEKQIQTISEENKNLEDYLLNISNMEDSLIKEKEDLLNQLNNLKQSKVLLENELNYKQKNQLSFIPGSVWKGIGTINGEKVESQITVEDLAIIYEFKYDNGKKGSYYLAKEKLSSNGLLILRASEWIDPATNYTMNDMYGILNGNKLMSILTIDGDMIGELVFERIS